MRPDGRRRFSAWITCSGAAWPARRWAVDARQLMVQTRKDARASDWFDVTRVEDVRGASGGGTGQVEVVCLAERKGVPQFRLQTHLSGRGTLSDQNQ